MKKEQLIRLFIESGLIVFSVLFALFIDRMAASARTNEEKRTALARIHQELTDNEKLIGKMIALHDEVIQSLTAAIENQQDTLRRQIVKDGYLNYGLLAKGKSLFPRYPSSTSWEAAKSTGIISEFEYKTIEACEGAYASQGVIIGSTLPKIVEDLFDLDASQMDKKLIKLTMKFVEISEQEKTLKHILRSAIEQTE